MKIGFYTTLSGVMPFDWTLFLDGKVGISGTDGFVLRIAAKLEDSRNQDFDLSLFTDCNFPRYNGIQINPVESFKDAVEKAITQNFNILIFPHREQEEFEKAARIAEQHDLKLIVWCHNTPNVSYLKLYASLPALRVILCVSQVQADHMRHLVAFKKTQVIHNFINLTQFTASRAKKDKSLTTYIGAITPNKGLQFLLKSWPEVLKKHPKAKLNIIESAKLYSRNQRLGPLGMGSQEFEEQYVIPYYGKSLESLKKANIKLLGILGPSEIKNHLAESIAVVVNPSFSYKQSAETFFVSAVEAQACRAAVVGGNVGGLRETTLNGETSLLANNQNDISRHLNTLLNNPELALKMGEQGLNYAKLFDINTGISQWSDLLKAVFEDNKMKQVCLNVFKCEKKVLIKELMGLIKRGLT
tara:strand:- start:9363 stop:10604 length:1242 start_codon:yes stop_codon:yes gene_type:complete